MVAWPAVAVLLMYCCVVHEMGGTALWPAVAVHLAFAVWLGVCLRRQAPPD
jgi:hypothetical protein